MTKTCKYVLFFTAGLLSVLSVFGADRYTVASGNWNSTSTWSASSGGAPGASVPVAGDNVFIENGYSLSVTANASCSNITFNGSSATLTVNSSLTLSVSASIAIDEQNNNSVSANISGGGTLSCNSVSVGSGANPPTGFISAYTHSINSSISVFNISGNLSINSYFGLLFNLRDGIFSQEEGTVTISGSVVTNNATALNTATLTMASGAETGTLVLSGGTPFSLGTGTNTITLNGSSTLVNYNFNGAQAIYATTYTDITLDGTGVKTFGAITVNGILSIEGTATTAGTTPTYGAASSIRYKGSAAQTTGIEFPSTFSGSGGVILDNGGSLTLNNNRTIDKLLSFTNGTISTGTYILTLSAGGTVTGAGTANYVNGSFEKGIGAGTASISFEVGDASIYAPIVIDFYGTTNGVGTITASTTSGDHPQVSSSGFDPAFTVNRYWSLINSGVTGFSSYDATFNFVVGDADSGTDYNDFVVGNYDAATWTYPTTGTVSTSSTQASGLTNFGDFQIGQAGLYDYRSTTTGNWNQSSTWQVRNGGTWSAATMPPTVISGTIRIRNNHTVTNTVNATADQLRVLTGGSLILNSEIDIANGAGVDLRIDGTLECSGSNIVSGGGSFSLSAGATLLIGSPDGISSSGATGNIQSTGTRTYDQAANYTYNGSSAQITGNGLPSVVNNLTVNNSSGLSLTGSETINGILTLTDGELGIGINTLTFQNSDTPIVRTSGTITTSAASNFVFGTAGNTAGAAFTIPAATFTDDPIITDLTINRANSLTFNEQIISVSGIVLCNGPLNTSGNLTFSPTLPERHLLMVPEQVPYQGM